MICHTHILYSSVIYHTSNAWTQKTNWSCKQRVHSRCGRLRRIQTSAKHCRKDFVPPKRLWYIILIYCTWVWCIILPTPETKNKLKLYAMTQRVHFFWFCGRSGHSVLPVRTTPPAHLFRSDGQKLYSITCIKKENDTVKKRKTKALHREIAFSKVIAFTIQQCYQH